MKEAPEASAEPDPGDGPGTEAGEEPGAIAGPGSGQSGDGAGNGGTVSLDDAPLNRFHVKITTLTFGANFSDGYHLGIIGIALTLISPQMHLSAAWEGLLGASALLGIFAGSIVLGWAAERDRKSVV